MQSLYSKPPIENSPSKREVANVFWLASYDQLLDTQQSVKEVTLQSVRLASSLKNQIHIMDRTARKVNQQGERVNNLAKLALQEQQNFRQIHQQRDKVSISLPPW